MLNALFYTIPMQKKLGTREKPLDGAQPLAGSIEEMSYIDDYPDPAEENPTSSLEGLDSRERLFRAKLRTVEASSFTCPKPSLDCYIPAVLPS